MYLQFCLIKNCIFIHQRKFLIFILKTVNQLAKNVQTIIHELIIICNEMCIFQNINTTFMKCWKTKRTHLQKKRAFSQKDFKVLLAKKKKENIQCFLMMKMLVH